MVERHGATIIPPEVFLPATGAIAEVDGESNSSQFSLLCNWWHFYNRIYYN